MYSHCISIKDYKDFKDLKMKRLTFAKNLDELQKRKKKEKLFAQTITDKVFEIKRYQKGRENFDI